MSPPVVPIMAPKAPHIRVDDGYWVGAAGGPASHVPWSISSVTTLSRSHSDTSRVSGKSNGFPWVLLEPSILTPSCPISVSLQQGWEKAQTFTEDH